MSDKKELKTKEELNALKEEVATLNKKLKELTEDELKQVSGGANKYFLDYQQNAELELN